MRASRHVSRLWLFAQHAKLQPSRRVLPSLEATRHVAAAAAGVLRVFDAAQAILRIETRVSGRFRRCQRSKATPSLVTGDAVLERRLIACVFDRPDRQRAARLHHRVIRGLGGVDLQLQGLRRHSAAARLAAPSKRAYLQRLFRPELPAARLLLLDVGAIRRRGIDAATAVSVPHVRLSDTVHRPRS